MVAGGNTSSCLPSHSDLDVDLDLNTTTTQSPNNNTSSHYPPPMSVGAEIDIQQPPSWLKRLGAKENRMAKTWVKGGGGGKDGIGKEVEKGEGTDGVGNGNTIVQSVTISAPPLARPSDLHLRSTQPHSWYSRIETRKDYTEGVEAPKEVYSGGR